MVDRSQQAPARKAITIKELAEHVGVHISTVSRALNPETRNLIGPDVVKRVLAAADELGYVPNSMAAALRTGQSRTVGILIPDLMNPVFPPFIRGIQDALDGAGYTAIIANSDGDKHYERVIVQKMKARFVAGLIMATALYRDDPAVGECIESGIPVVLINRGVDNAEISAVVNDDRAGIDAAVDHLVRLGHRRIVHAAGPQATYTGMMRHRAFVDAMQASGLPADETVVAFAAAYTVPAGQTVLGALLGRGKPFSAVIAANDQLALGALDRLSGAGLRVPHDVSLVGFNDMPLVDRIDPPLTTLRIQHYEMGAEAARILLDELTDPQRERRTVMLAPQLIVRGSTAPAA